MTTTETTTSYRELNAILDQVRRHPESVESLSDDQLLGLQRLWNTALSARLDQAIEFAGQSPLVDAVAGAWRELAADQATLRGVLDAAEERSAALGRAMSTEFRYLALAAGLVGMDAPVEEAIRIGRDYRDLIRSGAPVNSPPTSTSGVATRAD